MAGSTAVVNGVEATLFKDTDPPIYIMPDGRFAMRYGGLWKVRSSIAPFLKMIGRHDSAVKLMKVNGFYEATVIQHSGPEVIEAVSWERGVLGLKNGHRRKDRYSQWFLFDIRIAQSLVALDLERYKLEQAHAKAIAKLVKRYGAIIKRLKPVTEGSFRAIVSEIDTIRPRHSKAKVVKNAES